MTYTQAEDEMYMRRCIELAQLGEGRTYPNPMVGAVIVAQGRIIGEGWHRKAGEGHAEVNAVASVAPQDLPLLQESTIYVSLEPCAHYGKTPPCADLIVSKGIPRIVVGCVDTFAQVSGRGIEKLRNAGREVVVGVLEKECRQLNRRFFTRHEYNRPYVILKWAQANNGMMAQERDGELHPTRISDEACQTMVHHQRTTEQGILVGVGTAIADNPSLSARLWTGNQPVRFVVDPNLRMPPNAKLLNDGGRTIVINNSRDDDKGPTSWRKAQLNGGAASVPAILDVVLASGVQSLIVEGGPTTLQHFVESRQWDEAFVYEAEHLPEGSELPNAGQAPNLNAIADRCERVGNCHVWHYTNRERKN